MATTTTTRTLIDVTGKSVTEIRQLLHQFIGWADWYEAGVDPGSGITTVYLQAVKRLDSAGRTQRGQLLRLSFPSVVASGEALLERIANDRNARRHDPGSALLGGEYVLRLESNKEDSSEAHLEYLVGDLATSEGETTDDALGDPARYTGEHIKRLTLAALGAMIVEQEAEIRLNFCLPYSLYTPEKKEQARTNLDGIYMIWLNEIRHDFRVKVGTILPEGYGAITHYGSLSGTNVSVDIGDRTTEIILASGFKLVSRDSIGKTYGVRKVVQYIIDEIKTHGRILSVDEVRAMLKAYTNGKSRSPLKIANSGLLSWDAQCEIMSRKIAIMAAALETLIRKTLSQNHEGGQVGVNIECAIIYGGGGYIFSKPLREGIRPGSAGVLPDLYLPEDAEYLNASYAFEVVGQQSQLYPKMWDR